MRLPHQRKRQIACWRMPAFPSGMNIARWSRFTPSLKVDTKRVWQRRGYMPGNSWKSIPFKVRDCCLQEALA